MRGVVLALVAFGVVFIFGYNSGQATVEPETKIIRIDKPIETIVEKEVRVIEQLPAECKTFVSRFDEIYEFDRIVNQEATELERLASDLGYYNGDLNKRADLMEELAVVKADLSGAIQDKQNLLEVVRGTITKCEKR